jgi:very-short-patch-repair endonuclease
MHPYYHSLKARARILRKTMTDSEKLLWQRLRAKQILGIQCYRQKPIGHYIVDFYAPKIGLVIELDGGQHFEESNMIYDKRRSHFLKLIGISVLRYHNLQVMQNIDSVMQDIYLRIKERT